MKTLFIFQFETGDSSCRYWEVPIIINGNFNMQKYNEIEDSMSSFMKSDYGDLEYEDIVEKVMNGSGLSYEFIDSKVPECIGIYTMQI